MAPTSFSALVVVALVVVGGPQAVGALEVCSTGCNVGDCECAPLFKCDSGGGDCFLGVCDGKCEPSALFYVLLVGGVLAIIASIAGCICCCLCMPNNRPSTLLVSTPPPSQGIQP